MNNGMYNGMPMGQGSPFGSMPPGMDMGGPMISGTWINKRTGETVMVRDSISDGDNMLIITSNGQISMDEFSRDYIQASDEIYNESGKVISSAPVQTSEVTVTTATQPQQQINPNLLDDPDVFEHQQTAALNNQMPIKNFDLIDKIFQKNDSKPIIKIDVKWADFPQQELEMLTKYFDVTTDDIVQYIQQKFVSNEEIASSLKDTVSGLMSSKY